MSVLAAVLVGLLVAAAFLAVALVGRGLPSRIAALAWRLRDLARTVCGSRPGPVWAAVVADDVDDLASKLAQVRAAAESDGVFIAPD